MSTMEKMIRKLMLIVLSVAVMFSAKTCAAIDYRPANLSMLKDITGEWYTPKGELVISIRNGYLTINSKTYKIVSLGLMSDTAAFYKLTVDRGSDYGELELIFTGSSDGHEILAFVKNGYGLRKTKEPRYYESVGGVYLGMDKDQLVSRYGQPTSKTTRGRDECWIYNREGFEVWFDRWSTNMISVIKIYPRTDVSTARDFRRTVLAKNLLVQHDRHARRQYRGHGELIRLDNDGVTLQLRPDMFSDKIFRGVWGGK